MHSTTTPGSLALQAASLDTSDATPRAPAYADVYFSADGGLTETRHVFIDGNDLRARWARWHATRAFALGETGFGTGRNVLVAWQAFLATAPASARLHITSIERHPLQAGQLAELWQDTPALAPYARRLAALWPPAVRGSHRLRLDERVTLDLIWDDIEAALAGLEDQCIDAWFLDGFAPSRNAAMWSQPVFDELARASRAAATFATYSCARVVREHAAAAGFCWTRRRGAGRKRDMLSAQLEPTHAHESISPRRRSRPWCMPPAVTPPHDTVAVIGAGIAGASVAEALARRGHGVDVYDPHGGPGGASANAQAALHVKPAADGDTRTRFYLGALAYTQRWLADIDPRRTLWSDCGLLQLATGDAEAARQQRCLAQLGLPPELVYHVNRDTATRLAGIELDEGVRSGLYYPGAGWLRPGPLCRHLLERSGASVHATTVRALTQHDAHWYVTTADGRCARHAHVVLACAHHATSLWPADLPPLAHARGQVSLFEPTDPGPGCVVCGRGSIMPACNGQIQLGASFIADGDPSTPNEAEDRANIERLAAMACALAHRLGTPGDARVAARCISHDRLPCVGPIPDTTAWRRDYATLALDAGRIPPRPGRCQPGLWASLAHGANGMVSAPLAAEILASRLAGEPMPLSSELVDAVHPGRWLIRELKRGR